MPLDPERVKERRGSYGQTEIARRAGMTVQQWHDLENGRKPDPRVSTLERVAKVLGCTVDELLDPEKQLPPRKRKRPK